MASDDARDENRVSEPAEAHAASSLREATELQPQRSTQERHQPASARAASLPLRSRSSLARFGIWTRSRWARHVSILVSHEDARDHWANERTFLGMLRTSLAFAVIGTIVAQLLRLEHSISPNLTFGFFVLGVPLACICICCAILVTALGCARFLRQQNAIFRKKCLAGGWEMYTVGGLTLMTISLAFVLVLTVDVTKG